MNFIPYLQLNGTAREAIGFYEKVFGAENLGVMTYGDMPAAPEFSFPEGSNDLVSHGAMKVGESMIMLADTFPGQPAQEGNMVIVCITFNDVNQAHQVFEALQEGGQVEMPISDTGFSPAFGIIKDKFGVTFQIYTHGYQG